MRGSTPPWKRRSSDQGAASPSSDGVRDDERGREASLEAADVPGASSSLEVTDKKAPVAKRQVVAVGHGVREGVRWGGSRARGFLAYLTDRVIESAPRIPVRDLATLQRQFPGLGPEQLADKLVAGGCNATATVGAGVGAAAMMPVPLAMPTELAAEITGVAAIELKLIAELYEVYGQRPPGGLKERTTTYLNSWSEERGIDVTKPSTLNVALGIRMRHELRQRITKRMIRNMPSLTPFMAGAAVGAVMNRRETRRLADRVRTDLRKTQVPWDALPALPPLEKPADPLDTGSIPKELGH